MGFGSYVSPFSFGGHVQVPASTVVKVTPNPPQRGALHPAWIPVGAFEGHDEFEFGRFGKYKKGQARIFVNVPWMMNFWSGMCSF